MKILPRLNPLATARSVRRKAGLFGQPHLLYPNLYLCFVALSMIDLMLTCEVLSVAPGARELNPIAAAMVLKYDLFGLIAYKAPMTVLNIALIETVGRLRQQTGFRLAVAAVVITTFPIVWLAFQMVGHRLGW